MPLTWQASLCSPGALYFKDNPGRQYGYVLDIKGGARECNDSLKTLNNYCRLSHVRVSIPMSEFIFIILVLDNQICFNKVRTFFNKFTLIHFHSTLINSSIIIVPLNE